jgi:hypothetical protein
VTAAVEATPHRRRLWMGAAGALFLLAALGARTSSLAYINQTTFEAAITDDHPDDPTMVYYMASAAKKSGSIEAGRKWLSRIPEPPWPVAIVERTVELATELDDPRVRDMAVDYLATIEADN